MIAEKVRKFADQLPYVPRALTLVWEGSRNWTVAWALLLALQGLLPVATVYLTRSLVDHIAPVFRTHGDMQTLRALLIPAGLMGGVLLLSEAARSTMRWVRGYQAELVQDHISSLVQRRSMQADLGFYETPEFYDHLHRARGEGPHRSVALIESFGNLLQNTITLFAMAAVLLPFGPWPLLALLASTMPAFYVVIRYAARQQEWRRRVTPDERRARYYDWMLTNAETAAELRLFGLGEYFHALYRALRRQFRRERMTIVQGQSLAELGAGAIALVITAVAMIWTVGRAIQGLVSLGNLALFYQAFQQGLQLMRSVLQDVGQLYQNILFLGNLFEFLDLSPQVVDPLSAKPAPAMLREGIRFEGVRFLYPGSDRPVLDRFDLFVPAGRIVAIVGPNGAGKSTLLKLLCRFYDPECGSVKFDGTDLRDFALSDLRSKVTVLFQQPVHYNASVAENIAIGDLDGHPSKVQIEAAAEAAGAATAIGKLPLRYDNPLGKWFQNGAELSVGEWQRVALARAFVRRAPILILDEPTSAMDPWAEADWLNRFRRLAAGRTAIVITHRFTTAMLADEVHVIEAGRITESGSHEMLISRNGRYSEWWTAQGRSDGLREPRI